MSTKSIITAVLLIGLGIVFGVVLVSSFKGVSVTFAQDPVQIGSNEAAPKVNSALKALNDAFHTVAKDVTPSVVYITVKSSGRKEDEGSDRFFHFFGPEFRLDQRPPEIGAGSGVILTKNGYILTNNHVIDNADDDGIRVTLSDSRELKGTLVGTDRYTDLAVIKIDADNLPVPRLGNSDQVEVGHIVFAVGNPLGLTSTMTQGIVSALGRQINIIDDRTAPGYGIENFIQTDAAVNPGNSGGPLIDISGAVVGINTAIATTNQRYQGYSFAIPVNLAKKVASDIIRYGDVRRGYIGVNIQTVDAVTAKAQGLEKAKGVLVQSVNRNSAGEEAGLKPLDIILSVDGQEVNTSQQLQTIIATKNPGQTVVLKVFRDKKTIEKKITLKLREEEREVAAVDTRERDRDESEPAGASAVSVDELGLTVKSLDTNAKSQLEVENGVLVTKVEPFSAAGQRGINPGDVIVGVESKDVTNPREFKEAITQMKPGDAVMLRIKIRRGPLRYFAIQIPDKRTK